MERFGFDPRETTLRKSLRAVYFMLREDTRTRYGIPLGPLPEPADACKIQPGEEAAFDKKESEALVRAICAGPRITSVEQLDRWLASPDQNDMSTWR